MINPGKNKKGNKAVVAAGTGLGMAGIISADSGQLLSFATEGGHSTFISRGKKINELWIIYPKNMMACQL